MKLDYKIKKICEAKSKETKFLNKDIQIYKNETLELTNYINEEHVTVHIILFDGWRKSVYESYENEVYVDELSHGSIKLIELIYNNLSLEEII